MYCLNSIENVDFFFQQAIHLDRFMLYCNGVHLKETRIWEGRRKVGDWQWGASRIPTLSLGTLVGGWGKGLKQTNKQTAITQEYWKEAVLPGDG